MIARTIRLVVSDGGGYNPWTVGRCWALIWGTLNNHPIPDRLPRPTEASLPALLFDRAAGPNSPDHWFTRLLDAPRDGLVRDEIPHLVKESLSA
jgi:acetoin utilization protein AcuC